MLQRASAILLMLLAAAARPQDSIDPEKYATVKAAMILNFVRYTTWPAERFADSEGSTAPIVITVLGRDDMEDHLEELVRDETVHGRAIEVRHLERPQPDPRTGRVDSDELDQFRTRLRESHLLFIARSERNRYRDVLEAVEDESILTVSDIDEFASAGGMLGLAVRKGRVAFDANTQEIGDTELEVSSKLLRLANVVSTKGRAP